MADSKDKAEVSESSKRRKLTIVVNGRPHEVDRKKITYEEVVALSGVTAPADGSLRVKYSEGPKQNPKGKLNPGESVDIREGMVFRVAATHKS